MSYFRSKIAMIFVALMVLVGCIAWFFDLGADEVFLADATAVSATPTRDLAPAEQQALAAALSPGLNQPATVQWRWLPLDSRSFEKGQGQYCGYLNAKDGQGVYLGFQPFLAAVRTAKGQVVSGELALVATDSQALAAVKAACAAAGYATP